MRAARRVRETIGQGLRHQSCTIKHSITTQAAVDNHHADGGREGDYSFLCTGDVESFAEIGTRFLQLPLGEVERVALT